MVCTTKVLIVLTSLLKQVRHDAKDAAGLRAGFISALISALAPLAEGSQGHKLGVWRAFQNPCISGWNSSSFALFCGKLVKICKGEPVGLLE